MKGMSDVIKPFLVNGGRVKLKPVLDYAMNCGRVDESDTNFREKTYESNIVTIFNACDFYSVGDGEYVYIDDMTDKEREQKANEFRVRGNSYIRTADKLVGPGQGKLNFDTGEIEFLDAVKI